MLTAEDGSGGTGFLVKTPVKGILILTNDHVCRFSLDGNINVFYAGQKYPVRILVSYVKNDLCLVEAPSVAKTYFNIASSVTMGEQVYSIGHPVLGPLAVSLGELSGETVEHVVVGRNVEPANCPAPYYTLEAAINPILIIMGVVNRCIQNRPLYVSTIGILPGDSGSPAVNIWGNVVAIAVSRNTGETSISYHIPAYQIKEFLNAN